MEQEPVVFMGTIQENIILDNKIDKTFYSKVLDWCCLRQDLASLEKGDMTVI